ncbi:hypothetical protein DH2020_013495 [Rehmannia glutinosa]|uniref:Stress up-regulated Nod 19 protein n=1 Tax=Rehmannia glutinosa TaxID=99300 RepID=A0ABR0X4Z2_REHGL
MAHPLRCMLNFLPILLVLLQPQTSEADHVTTKNGVKTEVYQSPEFILEPGLSSNKYYYNIDFPRGHIALKSFNAELVDEKGKSIPLHETYLHHWILLRYYYQRENNVGNVRNYHGDLGFQNSDHIIVKNSGLCDNGLSQYFGLGAETRKTATDIPDPYGIEVGNPTDIPRGYEEGWILNVHAIDTRGVEDKLGCTECRCDLYNVTLDEYGQMLPENYNGGVRCCHDEARCKVKEGFQGVKRKLHLRYTVKYVDWDPSILPVKIYILDVTDIWTKGDESIGVRGRHNCVVEYDIDSCPVGDQANINGCIHTKTVTVTLPNGGDVIYGVGHQHAGATGTTLFGEGGRVICESNPNYGQGNEPGNEAGYVVGMSTCYPAPGSVKISAGEKLTLVSNYSNEQRHTGIMGLFYILLADSSPESNAALGAPVDQAVKNTTMSEFVWPIFLFGAAVVVVVIFVLKGRRGREEGYEAMI